MKNVFLRSICLGCLLFVLNFGKAQPIITEYFPMSEPVRIDMNDKKAQKSMSAKGILDIVWDKADFVMAITYDPKLVDSKDVVKTVQEIFGQDKVGTVSNLMQTK